MQACTCLPWHQKLCPTRYGWHQMLQDNFNYIWCICIEDDKQGLSCKRWSQISHICGAKFGLIHPICFHVRRYDQARGYWVELTIEAHLSSGLSLHTQGKTDRRIHVMRSVAKALQACMQAQYHFCCTALQLCICEITKLYLTRTIKSTETILFCQERCHT